MGTQPERVRWSDVVCLDQHKVIRMPSARMTALLGLLAVAGYQNRHKLGEMLAEATGQTAGGGQGSGAGAGAAVPSGAGTSAGAQSGARASGGGLLGMLGGQGGAGGLLGGLLGGGSAAGLLSGGLGELLDRFSGSGHGDVAKSWVGTGPNREIETPQLEQALGEDTIATLTQQTGLSREELLARLKTVLPTAVDKLTPQGHIPSETEAAHWT
jgi:uncharacterized protein YidB (DUF937 family)